MKPLAPKTTLQNRYQITKLIGKGGMGEVYLAIDQRLGHSIALKRTTVADDSVLLEAFEREARTLAKLRHSVLPKVSDHFSENDEQFLVMDYISGEDLSERLKATDNPFPLNWVLFWADQLLGALNYLHNHNPPIIHRDIKPQNLKLTDENHIVLLDFGLSKNVLGNTRVTTSGSVVGYTPHYAPMEQVRGTGTNARSDIFALSSTLYHLATNEIPADALTRADAMLAGLPDPLRPPFEINTEISQTISDAILKGMEISQEKRFGSAKEMQKILRRAYNSTLDSMSAETVAFNVSGDSLDNSEVSQTDAKTEVISDGVFPIDIPSPEPNLDATVQFNSEIDASREIEVPADSATEQSLESFETSEDIPSAVDFSTNDSVSVDDVPLPEATVPLILQENETSDDVVLEENPVDPSISNWEDEVEPEEGQLDSEASDFGLTETFAEEDETSGVEEKAVAAVAGVGSTPEDVVKSSPPGQKSSTGKYLGILGGLGAILFLGLGALAFGVYYSNGGFGTANDNSAETEIVPQAIPEITPELEVEPDPELVDTTNSSIDDLTNTETANENTKTTDETPEMTGVETHESNSANHQKKTTKQSSSTVRTQPPKKTTVKTVRKPTRTKKNNTRKTRKPPKKNNARTMPKAPPKKPKKKDAGVL